MFDKPTSCQIIAAGRKEYGGNIKVSGNVFDGMDYQADWASSKCQI